MRKTSTAQLQKSFGRKPKIRTAVNDSRTLSTAMTQAWARIAPFWPLRNLIAVNPVAGFEDLPFEQALTEAHVYFCQNDLPKQMQAINRHSIKWLQAFFDNGQATIQMPLRHRGLLDSILGLLRFDDTLQLTAEQKREWLDTLPRKADALIAHGLLFLGIPVKDHAQFLTLILTTLPGWAAHVQYRANWADADDAQHPHPVTQEDYLALRVVLTCLLWPKAKDLLTWHQNARDTADTAELYRHITQNETAYRRELLDSLSIAHLPQKDRPSKAQLVFCIDVRSEPFRRALEVQGDYDTYGFAGFFGLPVAIENAVTGHAHASCPVLLKPAHTVVETPASSLQHCHAGHERVQGFKKLYQSLKYTFTTPFSLVEAMGAWSGIWMGLKSLAPRFSTHVKKTLHHAVCPDAAYFPVLDSIPAIQQVDYGANALNMMGLTKNFAPLVVFCGHGSTTQNNAFATALDCGACGGRHGAPNARILAAILNKPDVRANLRARGIDIPNTTYFLAAKHNTTTDAVDIFADDAPPSAQDHIAALEEALDGARQDNSLWRCTEMGVKTAHAQAADRTAVRSQDWAQVRPEWGLARNAAFVIGPRAITQNIDLQGRSFLHSYDWRQDPSRTSLTTILTAPMVVAQWINAQYFFSSLDNVAFGGGSKVTKNITGKIGIMQGNASDLMHGLPLQSVYSSDHTPYHTPMRLSVVVHAPRAHIDPVIREQDILQKLFGGGWVHLVCHEPDSDEQFMLTRDLIWQQVH